MTDFIQSISIAMLAVAIIFICKTIAEKSRFSMSEKSWISYLDKRYAKQSQRLDQVECELQKVQSEQAALKHGPYGSESPEKSV